MKMLKKIDLYTIHIFLGYIMLGYGLFDLYGLAVSSSIMGGTFLFIGLFGEIAPLFIKKGS